MKGFFKLVSIVGLGLTVIPSILVFNGIISWNSHASLMLVGVLFWFCSAPLWMTEKTEK